MKECYLCHRRRSVLFMMELKMGGQLHWVCATTRACSRRVNKRIVRRRHWRHGKGA